MSKIAKPLRGPIRTALGVTPRLSPRAEITFAVPGSYTWIVPTGVTSISAVAVAGGGGSQAHNPANDISSSGGGGSLAWANALRVHAGQSVTVVVGAGGQGSTDTSVDPANALDGGDSTIVIEGITVLDAGGGKEGIISGATSALGGVVAVGDNKPSGKGGAGKYLSFATGAASSGGGAGGYSGTGGAGVGTGSDIVGNTGSGGGGGSGGVFDDAAGGSGGAGLFGEVDSGTAGGATSGTTGGGGGSLGQDGGDSTSGGTNVEVGTAGVFGAGGGAQVQSIQGSVATAGANGAVRIIWGVGREFPTTDVGQS